MLTKKEIIAVIGAGNMGCGIAQKYATHGHKVLLIDNNLKNIENAKITLSNMLNEAITKNIINESTCKNIISNITFSNDLAAVMPASMVIEAIFENLIAKQELFADLEKLVSKDVILASNTSSFLISQIGENLFYKNRLVGLHYFYHPAKNKLVEIIPSKDTDENSIKKVEELQKNINKIVIFSKDSSGFIVNRFFVPWLNEAMKILEENKANINTIDEACREFFGISMGPFELMNVTGPIIAYDSCLSLQKSFGNFYKPSEIILPIIEKKQKWQLNGHIEEDKKFYIAQRMLFTVGSIAEKMVNVEKICSFADIDLGACVGLAWKNGVFSMLNKNLYNFENTYKNTEYTENFLYHITNKTPFPNTSVNYEIKHNLGIITFNKPQSLNALDEELFIGLQEAFITASQDKNITSIILKGNSKAFMAGADLAFFYKNIQANTLENIINFTAQVSSFFTSIENCQKPVIALVEGLALGGGLELALCCKHIIATPTAKLGFPETSLGIYPGLGGTQRSVKKLGLDKARYLILKAKTIDAQRAHDLGLISAIAHTQDELMLLAQEFINKPIIKPDNKQFFTEEVLLSTQALVIADRLMVAAQNLSLQEGLNLELRFLQEIFSSREALEGISRVLGKK
jgi:enoyl-CoA hydratase/3-hydroxyacyl-CoA dehydrogenase